MNRRILSCLLMLLIASCGNKNQEQEAEHPAYHNPFVQPLTDSVRNNPGNARYYIMRSEALLGVHEDSLALKDAQKALQLDSTNLQYRYTVGYLQLSLKKYPEAIATLQKILQADAGNQNARFLLISAYLDTRRVAEAQDLVDEVFKAYPDHPQAWFLQAQIKAARKDRAGAIVIAQKLLASDPIDYEVSYQLADWYRDDNNPEAIRQYEKTFRIDTNDVGPLFDIGNIYEYQKQWKQAKAAYRECVLQDPDYTEAYVQIGKILLHQDSADKALRQFNIAISTSPVDAEAYFNKGLCFEKLGLKDSALNAFRQALVFDETLKEARERGQKLQNERSSK